MTPEDYEIFQYLIYAIACGLAFVGGFIACAK
jgi:hypothetical protein